MMEENNRKGPGIFYAVVGVATLVVAIIGATFAYFSASANVTGDAITGTTATTGDFTLVVDEVYTNTDGTLIPLDADKVYGTDSTYLAEALKQQCLDDNGDVACHVYSFTLTNGGSASLLTSTDLKLELTGTNTSADNWRWQVLSGDATSGFTADGKIVGGTTNPVTTATEVASTNLAAVGNTGNTVTYYVVIWLDDPGTGQTETGVTFTGTVTASSVDAAGNASGITATFNA